MSIKLLQEIIATEFLACFNDEMVVAEKDLSECEGKVNCIDDLLNLKLAVIDPSSLHVGRLVKFYKEIVANQELDQALNKLISIHTELANTYPSGTRCYQNKCLICGYALRALQNVAKNNNFSQAARDTANNYLTNMKAPDTSRTYFFVRINENGIVTPSSPFWNGCPLPSSSSNQTPKPKSKP